MPPLERKAGHAAPGADRALRHPLAGRGQRLGVVRFLHRHGLDVIQVAVVALEHQRIDRGQLAANGGIGCHGGADLRVGHGAHAEGVGQRDGRFQHAQLLHLHQPRALAEAVEHGGGCGRLVQERVAGVRAHHGHAGLRCAIGQRDMAHGDVADVADGIQGPAGKSPMRECPTLGCPAQPCIAPECETPPSSPDTRAGRRARDGRRRGITCGRSWDRARRAGRRPAG